MQFNKKAPDQRSGACYLKPGSVLLSHGISHTIIGAERFHFRVRNGIGWFTLAMAARQSFHCKSGELIAICDKHINRGQ